MKTLIALLTIVLLFNLPPATHAQDPTDACLTFAHQFDTVVRLGRGTINDLALSPDGTQLAVASGTGLWLYDAVTLQNLAQFRAPVLVSDPLAPPGGYVPTSVAWSPDGKQVAAGYFDGVRIWEVGTGQVASDVLQLPQVTHVAWSPDGGALAIITLASVSPYPDNTHYYDLYVFEMAGRVLNRIATAIIRNADQAVWSPDSRQLLYISSYSFYPDQDIMDYVPAIGAAVVWSRADGSYITLTPTDPNGYFDVKRVAWSSDGSTLALAVDADEIGDGNQVELWNVASSSMFTSVPYLATQLDWSAEALVIAQSSQIILVNDGTATPLYLERGVQNLVVNADASRIFISASGDLEVFDPTSQQVLAVNTDHRELNFFPVWSADGQFIAVTQRSVTSDEQQVMIYDTLGQMKQSFTIGGIPTVMAWSPDGLTLAVALYADRVDLISLADASITSLPVQNPNGLAWSPDSRQLASINEAGDVTVYDRATATSQTFPSPLSGLAQTAANLNNRIAWTTAGLRWVLSDSDSVFRVFGPNLETGATVLVGEIGALRTISLGTAPEILADGRVIYIPNHGDISLFDGTAVSATYPTLTQDVRWSMGGACYGWINGGTAFLVNTATGAQLNFLALPVPATWGLYGGTFWSPTGRHVYVRLEDGTALIWGH